MAKFTLTPEQRRERLDAAGQQLQAAVSSIVSSDDWQRALAFAGRFHNYSARNILLIAMQCQDRGIEARHVAGFRTWLSLGRHVRKGEKGLAILAPCTYKSHDDETGEDVYRVRGFKVEHVFADSQTDGDGDIPSRPMPALLTGEGPAGLYEALAALVSKRGYDITTGTFEAGKNGETNYVARTVTIGSHLEPAAACKTLCHELGHVMLHENRLGEQRGQIECEAESVAYLVLDAYGVASDEYSFPYAASWSNGKGDVVMAALEAAKTCAAEILEELEHLAA